MLEKGQVGNLFSFSTWIWLLQTNWARENRTSQKELDCWLHCGNPITVHKPNFNLSEEWPGDRGCQYYTLLKFREQGTRGGNKPNRRAHGEGAVSLGTIDLPENVVRRGASPGSFGERWWSGVLGKRGTYAGVSKHFVYPNSSEYRLKTTLLWHQDVSLNFKGFWLRFIESSWSKTSHNHRYQTVRGRCISDWKW